ncbi:hypothetical protein D9M69_459920 [compost metagenome]
MVLDVRPLEFRTGADEATGLELVAGAEAGAPEHPLRADLRLVPPLQRRVQRDRLLAGVLQVHLQVVLEVLADARQVVHHRHAEIAQQRRRADAGTLQQLRRGDGAGAHQHLAARAHFLQRVVVALQIGRPDGALAVEQDAVGQRVGDDGQVRPLAGLVQVAARSACTAPLRGDGAIHRTEAFLLVAVEILGAREAGLHARLDHGMEQRVVAGLGRGHADRAVAAVEIVRPDVAGLGLAEVRQAVEIGPVFQPLVLRPAIEVHGVAADVAHAVDQRGTAQALAAPALHAAVVHVRLGIGQVGPVVAPALQRERQRRRHLGAEVGAVVRAAGFQQQHADVGVLGQAGGEHVTGRAGADDDVVEFLGHAGLPLFVGMTPPATRARRCLEVGFGRWQGVGPATGRVRSGQNTEA